MRKSFNEAQPCGTCGEISILSCIKCCVPHSARAELTFDFSNDSAIVVTVCCRVDLGFYVAWFALDVMGFWGFSLIIVMNFLALQQHAHAQEDDRPHGKGFQQPTISTQTTVAPEQSPTTVDSGSVTAANTMMTDTLGSLSTTPSQTVASSSSSSSSPSSSPGYFPSTWNMVSTFNLDDKLTVSYTVEQPASLDSAALYVCQTNASAGEINSTNTWSVAKVPCMCTTPSRNRQHC
jgi:hypothetical protein